MTPVGVLVVFYSRYGETEKLALAAGLGAIQAKGNIRLRRVADRADAATIAASPDWKANVDRMHRDYVEPRPADAAWADVIVLATPSDTSVEMEAYLASLPTDGSMRGTFAAPVAGDPDAEAVTALSAAAEAAGLTIVPAPAASDDRLADCRAHGRSAVEAARRARPA